MAMPPPRFRVEFLEAHLKVLNAGRVWSFALGQQVAYQMCRDEMDFRLAYEADVWGESREWYARTSDEVRLAFTDLIVVRYALRERMSLVNVLQVKIDRRLRRFRSD